MGDASDPEPLKYRFSEYYHHHLYRYSIPTIGVKVTFEVLLWSAAATIPVYVIDWAYNLNSVPEVASINTKAGLWALFATVILGKLFCKTTIPRSEL